MGSTTTTSGMATGQSGAQAAGRVARDGPWAVGRRGLDNLRLAAAEAQPTGTAAVIGARFLVSGATAPSDAP